METTEGGLQGGAWKTSCSSLTRVILVETTEGGLQGGAWKTSSLTDDEGYNGRHIVAVHDGRYSILLAGAI